MKPKFRLFKYTFIILSIMCCLLLVSTTIYVMSDFNIINAASTPVSGGQAGEKTTAGTAASTVEGQPGVNTVSPDTAGEPGTSTSSEGTTEGRSPEEGSGSSPSVNSGKPAKNIPEKPVKTSVPAASSPSAPSDPSVPSAGPDEETENSALPGQEDGTKTITISAVGDIMMHQGNLNNAYSHATNTYDFNGFFEYVKPYLSKPDLAIANLETVTAGPASGYTSYPSFNTPDSIMAALSAAGFDVLSTANNHSLDRGVNGLTRTIGKIIENKMLNVGSSIDGKNKYITKEINGIKVSILSYSGMYNANDKKLTAAQRDKYLSPLNEAQIQKDIKAVKAAGTDAVIVFVHWGNEYQREPSSAQTTLAKKMLSWGADIILGSHPHVVQKSEIVKVGGKNKFIIYSMGNFISGYRRSDTANRPNKIYTEDGIVVRLTLEKSPSLGTIIKNVEYVPTWVDKYYVNNRPVFKIIPIPGADTKGPYINDKNKAFIKQSYKNTMDIMAKMK